MTTRNNLFPNGRVIFYEGDDPEGFRAEIKQRFGFDPGNSPIPDGFSGPGNGWNVERGYCFLCPSEHLDAIYHGPNRYPMGS